MTPFPVKEFSQNLALAVSDAAAAKTLAERTLVPASIPSGADLDTYTTAGVFHQNTNAGAAAGTNFPTPYAGLLQVYNSGTTSFVYQFYTRFRSGPAGVQATYWRTFYSNSWSEWQEVVVASQKGAYNGVATLDGSGRLPLAQAPIVTATSLPTTAHDLNDFQTPGPYWQNQSSAATLANNYPVAGVTCFLEVTNFGAATLQEVSTRVSPYRKFWRIKTGTTSWSVWLELVDHTTGLVFQGGMPSSPAQDLNNYTQRGQWAVGTSAIAASGANFPIGQSGQLLVFSAGYPGGSAASGCSQLYFAANSNRVFFRSMVTNTWTSWEEVVRSSLLGAPGGVATLDAAGKLSGSQAPNATLINAGTNANDVTEPGTYYLNSDANATEALNWPILIAGTLTVERAAAGNLQVTQTYTTRNGTGGVIRTFKRVRFGSSLTWGSWQEQAAVNLSVSVEYVTTPLNLNTLPADDKIYSWTLGTVVTGGTGWPPIGGGIASGLLEIRRMTTGLVHQTVTLLANGQLDRVFTRFGTPTGSWENWRMSAPVSNTALLPQADCGDVYVSGIGWYRWSGTAYAPVRSFINTSTSAATMMNVAMGGAAASGAIVEYGSNSNGTFIKFGDGTMICWIEQSVSLVGTTWTTNSAYTYCNLGGFTLPAAFASTPRVVAGSFSDGDVGGRAAYLAYAANANTTQIASGGYLASPNPSPITGGSGIARFTVVGKWK